MGLFRRRSTLPDTASALMVEFGPAWFYLLPQRVLEAVWDGDNRLIVSDSRRFAKVLSQSARPDGPVELHVNFVHVLYLAADRWTRVSHRDDPGSDLTRCAEVPIAVRELAEATMRQAAIRAGGKGEVMADWWMASAADLVVRCVRFRDGFAMPLLARELEKYPHLSRRADQLSALEPPPRPTPSGDAKPALAGGFAQPSTITGVRVSVHAGSGVRGIPTVDQQRARTEADSRVTTTGRHAAQPGPGLSPEPGRPSNGYGQMQPEFGPPPGVTDGPAVGPPPGFVGPPVLPIHSPGSYLLYLAQSASRIVNGVTEGASNAQGCMQLIVRRFGGQYPFATAMRAAMVAIRDGDQETLRELADMTAAAGEEDSPARVLHSLVLAGEKVLYGRVA